MGVQAVGVAVGLGHDDPAIVVLNCDVEHAVVIALRQEWTPARILFPLADNPACAAVFRDLALDLEAEAIPSLLPEAQAKAIGDADLVALAAAATVAVLLLDANRERAEATASLAAPPKMAPRSLKGMSTSAMRSFKTTTKTVKVNTNPSTASIRISMTAPIKLYGRQQITVP